MTSNQFSGLSVMMRTPPHPGARLVLVDGLSVKEASVMSGMREPAIRQAVARYLNMLDLARVVVLGHLASR